MTRLTVLVLSAILLAPVAGAAEQVIHVTARYDHGNATISDTTVTQGYPPQLPGNQGPYLLRLVDRDGDTVYSRRFTFDRLVHVEGAPNRMRDEVERTLIFPYSEHAADAVLYANTTQQWTAHIQDPPVEPDRGPAGPVDGTDTSDGGDGGAWPVMAVVAGFVAAVVVLGGLIYLSIVPG